MDSVKIDLEKMKDLDIKLDATKKQQLLVFARELNSIAED